MENGFCVIINNEKIDHSKGTQIHAAPAANKYDGVGTKLDVRLDVEKYPVSFV